MRKERMTLKVSSLVQNNGQLGWLPKNPRQWTQTDIDRTKASIQEDTDFLEDRPLLVCPGLVGKYVVFGGNLRLTAARSLKLKEVPVVVYCLDEGGPEQDEIRETVKRRAMKDNGSFGAWDYDALANEWDDLPLADFGVPVWDTSSDMKLTTEGREGGEGYGEFVDKFKQKLTTDDCYTPPEVYDAILAWIDRNIRPVDRAAIVRPFFPGGDYINHNYPEGCVVVDNPPFSIFSDIVRFYAEKRIPFFLFGPSLTLFTPGKIAGVCYIVANAKVVYENGAVVSTSFVTNLIRDDSLIWVRGDIGELIKAAQEKEDAELGKYDVPDNVLTSARIGKICKATNSDLRIKFNEAVKVNQLDGLKEIGKGLYGGGFLLSRAAAERAVEEQAAAERAAAERAAAEQAAEKARAVKIGLSPREIAIVDELDRLTADTDKVS